MLEDVKEELLKKSKNQLLVEQLANSILTYSDLLPSRNQNYKFDIEKFVDINGKTGIYLQYAQVRAKKILDQSSVSNKNILYENLNKDERNLMFEISKLPYYFFNSLDRNEPHHLAEYGYSLSQVFNSFYTNNKILSEYISKHDKNKRLSLVAAFYKTINIVFDSLGIKPVDEM